MSLLTKVCGCFLYPSHPPRVRALPQAVATWRALCQVEEGALGKHWNSFSSRVSGLLPRVLPRDFPLCSLGLGRDRGAQGQARYCWAGAAQGAAGGVGRAEPMGHCAGGFWYLPDSVTLLGQHKYTANGLIREKTLGVVSLWGSAGKRTRVLPVFGRHHLLERAAIPIRGAWQRCRRGHGGTGAGGDW